MKASVMPVRRPLSAAIAVIIAGGAAPAFAQDIRVDVTGSNIRRLEGEGALPVQVITRDEIDRTGAQSVAELLQYVSSNTSGGAFSVTNVIGTQSNSVSTASLRGLGGQNTLVLINGKRLTAASGEIQGVYGVNLDSIPFSAIERVEVLKDGASAVYGSDAIGGVINFILRQDFRGAEATLYYGAPTRGRRRREVECDGHGRLGRSVEGQVQRLSLGVLPEGRIARPEQAQLLRQQRRTSTRDCSASRATRSRRTSRPATSERRAFRTARPRSTIPRSIRSSAGPDACTTRLSPMA